MWSLPQSYSSLHCNIIYASIEGKYGDDAFVFAYIVKTHLKFTLDFFKFIFSLMILQSIKRQMRILLLTKQLKKPQQKKRKVKQQVEMPVQQQKIKKRKENLAKLI